ncbi:MAG: aminopeptidase P family protein [Lachnospiraceae bacterium]|nr:aminopeptidase P family protein [Lachnospiraceae bacterium]
MVNEIIRSRLSLLRAAMEKAGVSAYCINSSDYHNSEYVSPYFGVREFFSGFTGSNGTLIVTQDEAGLWTDGRYFIQAEEELRGTGISLYKVGTKDAITIEKYLLSKLNEGDVLGFDGRTVSASKVKKLKKELKTRGIGIKYKKDLSDGIFERPEFPKSPARLISKDIAGKSSAEKLSDLRKEILEKEADGIFLSKLDEIAWLFNIRGNDIPFNPVLMSYAYIGRDKAMLFIQSDSVTEELRNEMLSINVELRDYSDVKSFLKSLTMDNKTLVSTKDTSYYLYKTIKKYSEIIDAESPIETPKAVKNEVELMHIKKTYLRDSLALIKFIHNLSKNIGEKPYTEYSAAEELLSFRKAIPEFMEPAFDTISAYRGNAAMMHYSPSADRPVELEKKGMLLVDSGGQYIGGTTDVTRTLILGEISEEERFAYTLVCCSMLNLLYSRFLSGATGRNLDTLARIRLWNEGFDYKCGTGHGIGYMLNVHEGPHTIRMQNAGSDPALLPGMLVTDEPGIYRAGRYGIRTENVLVVREDILTEDGQFLKFENLTFVPIDDRGMDRSIMTERELSLYIKYQTEVCNALNPYLTDEERVWIKGYAGI